MRPSVMSEMSLQMPAMHVWLSASTANIAPFQPLGPPALPLLQRRTRRLRALSLRTMGESASWGSAGMGVGDAAGCSCRSCCRTAESLQSSVRSVVAAARGRHVHVTARNKAPRLLDGTQVILCAAVVDRQRVHVVAQHDAELCLLGDRPARC